MSSPSRTAQFAKVHKVLKKHYEPVTPNPERPVLEHLLFACCLENSPYDKAEEVYAALVHTFFDWNEIRVTTVKELSEVLAGLPDPGAAAQKIKKILQHVFESTYSFDLEEVRKKNLGPAVERLEKVEGASKFVRSYVIQSALGGHSIPLDAGTLAALHLLDLATDADVKAEEVSGMERAVAKNKGIEFGSLLHRLGADFTANPYLPALHKILLQINPDIEDQLPKRRKKVEPEVKPEPPAKAAVIKHPAAEAKLAKGKGKSEPVVAAPAVPPAPESEHDKSKAKKNKKKESEPTPPAASAPPAAKSPAASKAVASPAANEKKPAPGKKKPITLKKVSADDEGEDGGSSKRSAAVVGLSKKKPR
jgi:hypothetical protein